MSAKETIKRIVDSFNSKPYLKDKTREMGEGLMLGASLADESNERSKEATATTKAIQEKYKEQILAQDLNPNKDPELVDLRSGNATAGERITKFEQETTAQFQQTEFDIGVFKSAAVYVDSFERLPPENDDQGRVQRAIDSMYEIGGDLIFSRKEYTWNSVVVRAKKPIYIWGYGASLKPKSKTEFMFKAFGNSNKFFGLKFEPTDTVTSESTYRGIEVTNDTESPNTNYNYFQDIEMYNMYQGIKFYMKNVGGASYRHQLNNCIIRNQTISKTWSGSYGVSFDGDLVGDSSGNDSKLIGCYVKGYESNVIVRNSVGTKMLFTSLDGAKNSIVYDAGSHLTLIGCYMEYNDTVFKLLNSPYRLNIVLGTISNQTKTIDGSLLGNERPIFLNSEGAETDLNESLGYFLEVLNGGISQLKGSNAARMTEGKRNQFIDFKNLNPTSSGFDLTAMTDTFQFLLGNIPFRIGGSAAYVEFSPGGEITLLSGRRIEALLKAQERATDLTGSSSKPGDIYYNSTRNVFRGRENGAWVDFNTSKGGATSNRPSSPVLGTSYFDTNVGKRVDFNGTNWVDSNGTIV